MQNSAISLERVSKKYRQYHQKRLILNSLSRLISKETDYTEIPVLSEISFDVERGEIFGVIGRNGSGKSTLLRVISSITQATEGLVRIQGRLVSLMELGVGFEPELTGLENVFHYGMMLGMNRSRIRQKLPMISDFSGIGVFLDRPLKTYSSGMVIRLAFSIAIHSDPDILLLDEIFGVGDIEFQQRCLDMIRHMISRGSTIVLVSHDMSTIGNICRRAICLENGRLIRSGEAARLAEWYSEIYHPRESKAVVGSPPNVLTVLDGQLQIRSSQEPVTVLEGAQVIYGRPGHEIASSDPGFQILPAEEGNYRIAFRFLKESLEQTWTIQQIDPETFEWIIEPSESINRLFDEMRIELRTSYRYGRMYTPELEQDIPPIRLNDKILEPLLMRCFPRKFLAVAPPPQDPLPCIVFSVCDQDCLRSSQISNGNFFTRARILTHYLNPNLDKSVRIRIRLLGQDSFSSFIESNRLTERLVSGSLSVYLTDNIVHLAIDESRITGDSGLLCICNGKAADRLIWEKVCVEPVMVLRGHSMDRPLVFIWCFSRIPGGFEWQLSLESLDPDLEATFSTGIEVGDSALFHSIRFSPEVIKDRDSGSVWRFCQESSSGFIKGHGVREISSGSITCGGEE